MRKNYANLYEEIIYMKHAKPKVAIGDRVRSGALSRAKLAPAEHHG